jgi:hypothetical protein
MPCWTERLSQGTSGYRAPGLVKDEGHYNNESDMVKGHFVRADCFFQRLSRPISFPCTRTDNSSHCPRLDELWSKCISDIVSDMLQLDAPLRPSARDLVATFSIYYKLAIKEIEKQDGQSLSRDQQLGQPDSVFMTSPNDLDWVLIIDSPWHSDYPLKLHGPGITPESDCTKTDRMCG